MLKKAVSLLLSFVLLSACAVPAFAAEEPQAQSDPMLEGMWEAYEARDMEQLQAYFDALGVNDEEEEPTIAPRWASGDQDGEMCHQELAAYGFLWYVGAMQNLYGKQLAAMGYTWTDLQTLVENSPKPDKQPIDRLFRFQGHFYDPDSGRNFEGREFPTAKTQAAYYYNQAISSFHSGDRANAMKWLGFSLHFLQDANEPHHAANITAVSIGSRHSSFETYAAAQLEGFILDDLYSAEDLELEFFSSYLTRSVPDSVHEAAKSAKALVNWAQSDNDILKRICAFVTLGNSMAHTSGLLYRFAKDTRMI